MQSNISELDLAKWKKIISECESSGMNKTDWCKEQGISEGSYYKWRKRIFDSENPTEFVEINKQTIKANDPSIKINKGEYSIEITSSTSDDLIFKALKIMSYVK